SKLVACAGAATVANYRRLRKLPSQFELGRRGEEVLVSGLVLDRYLAEGGEVDAVYGALSTDERLDVASILERQEQLRKAWAIRFSVLQRTANHRKTGALVRALAQVLATEIRDLPDDQAAIPRENLQERV